MNRRSFFGTLAKAAAGFYVLPAATSYARRWRPTAAGVLVPDQGLGLLNTNILMDTVLEIDRMMMAFAAQGDSFVVLGKYTP